MLDARVPEAEALCGPMTCHLHHRLRPVAGEGSDCILDGRRARFRSDIAQPEEYVHVIYPLLHVTHGWIGRGGRLH